MLSYLALFTNILNFLEFLGKILERFAGFQALRSYVPRTKLRSDYLLNGCVNFLIGEFLAKHADFFGYFRFVVEHIFLEDRLSWRMPVIDTFR